MACEIIIPIKLGRISSLTQPARGPFLIAQMDDSTIAVTVVFYPYIRNSEGPSEKKKTQVKEKSHEIGPVDQVWLEKWLCSGLANTYMIFAEKANSKSTASNKTEGKKTARHWKTKKAVVHGLKPLQIITP